MKPNIADILVDSHVTAWKNPSIWILGWCAGGGPAGFLYGLFFPLLFDPSLPPEEMQFDIAQSLVLFAMGMVMMVVMFLLYAFFTPVVVHGVASIDRKLGYDWRDSLAIGRQLFGRFAALGLLLAAVMIAVMILFGILLMIFGVGAGAIDESGIAVALFLGLGLAASVFVILVIYAVFFLAERSLVVDGTGIGDSVKAGWEFFRDNFGRTLGVGFSLISVFLFVSAFHFILAQMLKMAFDPDASFDFFGLISPSNPAFWLTQLTAVVLTAWTWTVLHNAFTLLYDRTVRHMQATEAATTQSPPPTADSVVFLAPKSRTTV